MNRSFLFAMLAAPILAAMGCNAILGIDKTYRETDSPSGSAASAGSGGAGGGAGGGHAIRPLWMKRFGSAGNQTLSAVAVDTDDTILVLGCFRNTIDFGGGALVSAGDTDLLLARLDASGKHIWSKRFGDASRNCEHFYQYIDIDPQGNIVIAGSYEGSLDFGGSPLSSAGMTDAYIAKLSPTGAHVWSKRFGDAYNQGIRAVAVDADGSIFIGGGFQGTINLGGNTFTGGGLGPGQDDVFLGRLDSMGAHVWSKSVNAPGATGVGGIRVDTQGNLVVVVGGGGLLPNTGDSTVWIAKYAKDGAHLWSKLSEVADELLIYRVALSPSDEILFGGRLNGTVDFGGGPVSASSGAFVAKLASNGDHAHSKALPMYYMFGFAVDTGGRLFVGGSTSLYANLGGGLLEGSGALAKLDPDLQHVWSVAIGEGDPQAGALADPFSIDVDSAGNVVVGGNFNTSIVFGADTLTSAGELDVYIAKFPP